MSSVTSGAAVADGDSRDLPELMTAMREAFDPAFGEAWTEAQCAGIMGMPGTWLQLARDGERALAGFALARAIGDEGELLLLSVRPDWRGRGIGRTLLDAALDEAKRRGVRAFNLEVRESNRAIALYTAAGFTQVGVRRDYYRGVDGKSYDALTFTRMLDAAA